MKEESLLGVSNTLLPFDFSAGQGPWVPANSLNIRGPALAAYFQPQEICKLCMNIM
jgi:hypothetical protein